jgi:hypothetical protein
MAGLQGSCNGFAYTIDSKEGGYVLNITNAAAILIRDEMTGDFAAGVLRVIPISKIITRACLNPIFLEGMSEYHTIPNRFGPVASRQE